MAFRKARCLEQIQPQHKEPAFYHHALEKLSEEKQYNLAFKNNFQFIPLT